MERKSSVRQVRADITKHKKKLIKKASKNGLYENFGQREVRKLTDRHIDISDYSKKTKTIRLLLDDFNIWCMLYTG